MKRPAGTQTSTVSSMLPVFTPVALQVVKLACERPDQLGCSLSQWDCSELARKLQAEGIVHRISPATIRRLLHSH